MVRRRGSIFFHQVVLRPIILVVGFIVKTVYAVLFGYWWGLWWKKYGEPEQQRLFLFDIKLDMAFLLERHGGRIVENGDIGGLALVHGVKIATIEAEQLLFRFMERYGEKAVWVSSERLPGQWQELGPLLNVMLPDKVERHNSVITFNDAARLLEDHWETVKAAFSEAEYAGVKKKLDEEHEYEMKVTRAYQDEINRRLYERG